jgi:hypothetical protein
MAGTPNIRLVLIGFVLLFDWPLLHLTPDLYAQQDTSSASAAPRDTIGFVINASFTDSVILLPQQFIIDGSDRASVGPGRRLIRGVEYQLDYRNGSLLFDSSFVRGLTSLSDSSDRTVVLEYAYLPFRFQDAYYKRELMVLKDSAGQDAGVRIARPPTGFSLEEAFGPNLQKSGSIVRGFTVGSNRDLSLNSGLRLQFAGRISSDIEVAAALTDESTPIQPEGTTQSLQEFDEVYVEIKSTDLSAILGDFSLQTEGTEFATVNRHLQGAKGIGSYRVGSSRGSAMVAGAITRGTFNINQFTGIEGVQGPYRLTGRNGETFITIVAGTERVYIDGEPMVRGETNDYVIDYSLGEILFTARRLIISASRITVDFQYTERAYARSFLSGQNSSTLFDDKATLSVSYFREADDPDAPIDLALTDSARLVLAQAGSDPGAARLSGVTRVDSNGLYVRVDTVLSTGDSTQFFRYAPGDSAALYVVSFSFVGTANGEYVRIALGLFEWKGPGGGDYLPVRFVPLPEEHQLIDVALKVRPGENFRISAEYARSIVDSNRSSTLDATGGGNAFHFDLDYRPTDVRIGGLNIGSFEIGLKERFVQEQFVSLDRINVIEFDRKWALDTTSKGDEEIREATLGYLPVEEIAVMGGYGEIRRGDLFRSKRLEGSAAMRGEDLPKASYYIERITSKDQRADEDGRWLRQRGQAEYTFWRLTPVIRYEAEDRKVSSLSTGQLSARSYSFEDVSAGIRAVDLGKLSLFAMYSWRREELFLDGSLVPESDAFTQSYGLRLAEWNNLFSTNDLTFRKRDFTQEFEQKGRTDIKSVVVRSQNRYSPLKRGVVVDLYYQAATEQSSRLQRIFVKVTPGSGNFRYLGDLNNNGIADEEEFVQARFDGDFVATNLPTDQLFPVIDLRTSLRLRFTPKRFIRPTAAWEDVLTALSFETYVRIDEKSTEGDLKRILLLNLNSFQQDSTTITGALQFTQDIHLFENKPDFSMRLRFFERRGMNNVNGGIERGYGRDRSARIRWQFVREISSQVEYTNSTNRLSSSTVPSRNRDIASDAVSFVLSYRPEQDIQFSFEIFLSRADDSYRTPDLQADINTQTVSWIYSFQSAGQLRLEASREEVLLSGPLLDFPFELTGGKPTGKSWLWRGAFDYRLTGFIQATVNYDGRVVGGRAPIHSGSAEVRAFF